MGKDGQSSSIITVTDATKFHEKFMEVDGIVCENTQ